MTGSAAFRAWAALLLAWPFGALAQGHSTTRVVTNGHTTITTTIMTNGSAVSVGTTSFGSAPGGLDPQELLRAFTGAQHARTSAGTNPVTWLGLAADEVSDELRAHLPLPDGAGLIVRDVGKDSPAAVAGLQENDIVTRFDDQLLVNPPQLQSLIRSRKNGDETTLTVLRKGREMKIKAKLGQRMPDATDGGAPQVLDLGSFNLDMDKVFGKLGSNGGPIVFQRSFSGGTTNHLDAGDLQSSVQKAVQEAMEKMRREMDAAMPQPEKSNTRRGH